MLYLLSHASVLKHYAHVAKKRFVLKFDCFIRVYKVLHQKCTNNHNIVDVLLEYADIIFCQALPIMLAMA